MVEATFAVRIEWERRPRRGAVLVESAIIITITLAFVLGIFEFGRVLMMRQLLDNAAREGARLAVVSTDSPTGQQDVQDCVTRRMAGKTLTGMSIQVYKADPSLGTSIGSWTDAALGECIAVSITGTYQPFIPVKLVVPLLSTPITLLSGPRRMSAKAVMNSEAN